MCNAWCVEFAKDSLKFWPESPDVLEVGARDVDGRVRPVCEALSNSYVGVDIEEGNGVDALVDANKLTEHFELESFDIVISTETVEHIYDWPNVFYQMMSVLKQDGLLILTTRSIGFGIHDYPDDYWRYSRKDMSLIFKNVGEILAMADDMTLGYPCGIGVVIEKKASPSELETWKQYLTKSCALYNVNISHGITFEDYHSPSTAKTLQTQLADKEQAVQSLSAQLAEKEQALQSLSAQLAEKEQAVHSLQMQMAEWKQVAQRLRARIAELVEQVAERQRAIDEIASSKSWRLIETYRHIWRRILSPAQRLRSVLFAIGRKALPASLKQLIRR